MTEFIVHSIPGSPYGRAVLIALQEKGARYRLSAVAPGSMRTAEHLARHPFGKVPILEHGALSLYETQAILRYLDRVLPAPAQTPADATAAARMDLLMNVNDWYLFQGCQNVIGFQRIIAPRLLGLAPDEAAIAAAMPRAHQVFDELARKLGNQPFFVGDTFTLADIMLAPQLDFLRELPEWQALTSQHANLRSWLERVNQRPSLEATTWQRVAAMAQVA